MPTCQSCSKDWNWMQTFKKSFTLDTGMKCPFCHEKQYLTTKSRKRTSFTYLLTPILMFFSILIKIPPVTTFFILLGGGLLLFSIYPFFVELSNKEEPLW